MSAGTQPDLIDAAELPTAFVETWRALEGHFGLKPATLAPIFVRNLLGDTWIAVRIDGAKWCVNRSADAIEAAKELWRNLGRVVPSVAASTADVAGNINNNDEADKPLHLPSTSQRRAR